LESTFDRFRKHPDRELTAPTERSKHGSLAHYSLTGRLVIQLRAEFTSWIIDTRLDGQSALPRRRAHLLGRENL
jgi:hypothetical protein